MTETLKGKGLEEVVDFDVQVVGETENDPKTGKFKLIIPFKPAHHQASEQPPKSEEMAP